METKLTLTERMLSFIPGITATQRNSLIHLAGEIFSSDLLGKPERYEIKKLTVERLADEGSAARTIVVYVKSGLIGDEGTAAEAFARDSRHVFIGPRGRIEAYGKDCKKVSGSAAYYTHCSY